MPSAIPPSILCETFDLEYLIMNQMAGCKLVSLPDHWLPVQGSFLPCISIFYYLAHKILIKDAQ